MIEYNQKTIGEVKLSLLFLVVVLICMLKEQDILPKLTKFIPFGNFSELNFAQVGHGIGYYNANNTSAGNGTHV